MTMRYNCPTCGATSYGERAECPVCDNAPTVGPWKVQTDGEYISVVGHGTQCGEPGCAAHPRMVAWDIRRPDAVAIVEAADRIRALEARLAAKAADLNVAAMAAIRALADATPAAEALERRVRAETLYEAADAWCPYEGEVPAWLRDRAADIERGVDFKRGGSLMDEQEKLRRLSEEHDRACSGALRMLEVGWQMVTEVERRMDGQLDANDPLRVAVERWSEETAIYNLGDLRGHAQTERDGYLAQLAALRAAATVARNWQRAPGGCWGDVCAMLDVVLADTVSAAEAHRRRAQAEALALAVDHLRTMAGRGNPEALRASELVADLADEIARKR